MRRLSLIPAFALLCMASPALAQTVPAAQAAPSAAPSPQALAEARLVALKLIRPGTYKTIMSATMDNMMSNMGDALKAFPIKDIAKLGGLKPEEAKALDKMDLAKVMAIYDPHWEERQQLTMHAMFAAMGDFFTTMEPDLREATARAYANHFSLDELRDLNRYFETPTGAKYAARSMTIMTDPAMTDVMKDMMPRMMQQMPHFIEAARKATASLPPARRMEDLTPAEREALAKALGIDAAKLPNAKSKI